MNYATALEKSRAASRVFAQAQADYRAQRIGDAEFLAARAVHNEASRKFDVAFTREQEREMQAEDMMLHGDSGPSQPSYD